MKLKYSKIIKQEITEVNQGRRMVLHLECRCGKVYKRRRDVTSEDAMCRSCASRKRATSHNMTKSPVYGVWKAMIQRCNNPADTAYKDYGARGLTVCKNWHKLQNFYDDMEDIPKGRTLDRIDNNKGYYPKNCKWSTWVEQNNNKRNTVFVKYKGKITPISVLAKQYNIDTNVLNRRIFALKWSTEEALTTPVRACKSYKRRA